MRVVAFFLQFAGWLIVLAAIALLTAAPQTAFALAGFCVQLLGLTLLVRAHRIRHGEAE
ncbi:MAG: hypothetical protein M3O20_15850 [Acidobacteriota bacterium]|nr:hypothetical protein [Acidobacteriota bacterium]